MSVAGSGGPRGADGAGRAPAKKQAPELALRTSSILCFW